ncbi:DUF4157 domain-containing protein [Tateyamaria sp. SN6-1]|uniref:eCIS core domain-containing protein n=1 Tax=Tateyamaria sp. SN6-1 TaxID=3092148 RepID=UPI0039F5C5B1
MPEKLTMAVNSNCQNVAAAVKAVAQSMGVSEADALKVLVSRGAKDYAQNMSARAFTQGSKVSFGAGAQTGALGHEVTHTIQQSTRQIEAANSRASAGGGGGAGGPAAK